MATQQALTAPTAPIGLFPAFCFDKERKLIFKDGNAIHDTVSNVVVLKYQTTSHFLDDDTREFMDPNGKILFSLARIATTGSTQLVISDKPVSSWSMSSALQSKEVRTATGSMFLSYGLVRSF
jgi:hypothetical protein